MLSSDLNNTQRLEIGKAARIDARNTHGLAPVPPTTLASAKRREEETGETGRRQAPYMVDGGLEVLVEMTFQQKSRCQRRADLTVSLFSGRSL